MAKRSPIGWVALHRKLLESATWENHNVARLWIWCLLKATRQELKQVVGFKEVKLNPGQFIFGRKTASDETGISQQTIRTCLKFLKKAGNLTIESTSLFSVITIVNWESYQFPEKPINQPINQQPTSSQPAANHKQQGYNGDNIENKPKTLVEKTAFDEFWKAWPKHFRKAGKAKCKAKWKKDKLDSNAEHVIAVLEARQKSEEWTKEGGAYIPAPMAWLNKQSWDCELGDITSPVSGQAMQIGRRTPPTPEEMRNNGVPENMIAETMADRAAATK